MDYFSKWPEARALKEHTAETVAKFLFEDIICRHGCVKIQINDQSKEFVNEVSTKLHKLTGSQQYISAYHNQSIGLVELQNSIIKHSFIKSLVTRSNWVEYLPAVLFAYRTTTKHSSTKMTPFEMVYNRQAVVPAEQSGLCIQWLSTSQDR